LVDSESARTDTQVSLLFTLTSLSQPRLEQVARSADGKMQGWVALAQILSGQSAPSAEVNAELRAWRQAHRGHPALAGLDEAYFATLSGGYPPGTRTLVLLPSGGRFGSAGDVLRYGITAAYEADRSGSRPTLDFTRRSASAYTSLVGPDTDFVIGPLPKSSVAKLAEAGPLPVPTLALNRTDGGASENLFQFSLAPEDEAESAANYAFEAGLRRAALVYPQSGWGTRMAQAFRTQWRALGGTLTVQPSYGAIRGAAERVASSDAEVVLLVATTKNVVALWEALRSAGFNGPVIATSHVHDGRIDLDRSGLLNGLYFVDIPWLLDQQRSDRLSRQALRDRLPSVSGPLARLYAMGIDAYRLAPHVTEMKQQPGTFFPGETGGLSIDARGRVHRQLTLARFSGAGVVMPAGITKVADASTARRD
jgi:hypothetical protein